MHDFRKLVAPNRKQDPREREIIVACHLEEMYMELRRSGGFEETAFVVASTAGKKSGSHHPQTAMGRRRRLENLALSRTLSQFCRKTFGRFSYLASFSADDEC